MAPALLKPGLEWDRRQKCYLPDSHAPIYALILLKFAAGMSVGNIVKYLGAQWCVYQVRHVKYGQKRGRAAAKRYDIVAIYDQRPTHSLTQHDLKGMKLHKGVLNQFGRCYCWDGVRDYIRMVKRGDLPPPGVPLRPCPFKWLRFWKGEGI